MKTKKAYQMKLDEYKENVSPILKEFRKFIKKNSKYFAISQDFYGVLYYTFNSYIQYKIEEGQRCIKREDSDFHRDWYSPESQTKKAIEVWENRGGIQKDVPSEILDGYNTKISNLKKYFGEYITKIQSDENNSNKRSVRRAIDDDSYVNDMLDEVLTPDQVEEIINSVGLKMSKRLKEMKTKVETEGYSRSTENRLISVKNGIQSQIENVLQPYTDTLKDKKEKEVLSFVDGYLKSNYNSVYKYSHSLSNNYNQNDNVYRMLSKYIDHKKEKNKSKKFDQLLEKEKEDYVQYFISKFVERFNEKISVVCNNLGKPKMKFEVLSARYDNLIVVSYIDFPNNIKLYCETDVILAGGSHTMQRLHERYLMKFFKDGKKISLEEIDNLK